MNETRFATCKGETPAVDSFPVDHDAWDYRVGECARIVVPPAACTPSLGKKGLLFSGPIMHPFCQMRLDIATASLRADVPRQPPMRICTKCLVQLNNPMCSPTLEKRGKPFAWRCLHSHDRASSPQRSHACRTMHPCADQTTAQLRRKELRVAATSAKAAACHHQ